MTRTITFAQAINEAMAEELERDDTTFVMGQDVGAFGGIYGVTAGLQERFGDKRVFDTPISEMFLVGGGVGAALTGMRPIVELQFGDFILNAADEVFGKMGKWRYMHGGLFTVPMVLRLPEGAMGGAGPEHSQCPEALLLSAPGLHIAIPSTPADAKGLLKAAIRSPDPVCFFEHKALYNTKGPVPDGDVVLPLGTSEVKRAGADVSIVTWGRMVQRSLEAAERAAAEGIEVEVLDTRGLHPLDEQAILDTVGKTGRLVVVHEAGRTGGAGGEIAAIVAEKALLSLEAPIRRVCGLDVPIPQNIALEQLVIPSVDDIHAAIVETHRS